MLDLNRIAGAKLGKCEDTACLEEDTPDLLTYVRYIASNKGPAWICQGCIEVWSDELESFCDNQADEITPMDGYPFIP